MVFKFILSIVGVNCLRKYPVWIMVRGIFESGVLLHGTGYIG
jgi:hypothetical protein